MSVVIRNGVRFIEGSSFEKIGTQYFLGKTPAEIQVLLNLPIDKIEAAIYRINRRSGTQVSASPTTQANNISEESHLHIHLKEQAKNIVLFIKTDKKFEDWMSKKKECRQINNLWGQGICADAYIGEMIDKQATDDLNRPVLLQNSLNYAILRLKNISNGVEVQVKKNLVTKERLIELLTDFSTKFDNFYVAKILKDKIEIEFDIVGAKKND